MGLYNPVLWELNDVLGVKKKKEEEMYMFNTVNTLAMALALLFLFYYFFSFSHPFCSCVVVGGVSWELATRLTCTTIFLKTTLNVS